MGEIGEVKEQGSRAGFGLTTYSRLSGRADRLKAAACHAQRQSSQEEVEKLHGEEKCFD